MLNLFYVKQLLGYKPKKGPKTDKHIQKHITSSVIADRDGGTGTGILAGG